MPTDLEMRLLSSMLIDLDATQLRRLVIHVAEKEFEVVGAEVLRIKEEMRTTTGSGSGQLRHQNERRPVVDDLESECCHIKPHIQPGLIDA